MANNPVDAPRFRAADAHDLEVARNSTGLENFRDRRILIHAGLLDSIIENVVQLSKEGSGVISAEAAQLIEDTIGNLQGVNLESMGELQMANTGEFDLLNTRLAGIPRVSKRMLIIIRALGEQLNLAQGERVELHEQLTTLARRIQEMEALQAEKSGALSKNVAKIYEQLGQIDGILADES